MDTITISFARLDAHTQSAIREALVDVIETRKGKVIDVIQGATVGWLDDLLLRNKIL